MALDHRRAEEISRYHADVDDIKRRAHGWRLLDAEPEVLSAMRQRLLNEIDRTEQRLKDADANFNKSVQNGQPIEIEQTIQVIDRITLEWERLKDKLQEVDEAILERNLRTRLGEVMGGQGRVALLDVTVLISIIVVVTLTLIELVLSLPEQTVSTITVIDTVISLFLLGDFFLRLSLAEDKRWYWRNYWIDFISSIPFYQVLRFGRLLRLTRFTRFARLSRFSRFFRLLRIGRAFRVLLFAFRGLDKLFRTFQVNLLKRTLLIAAALLMFGALSISAVEGPTLIDANALPPEEITLAGTWENLNEGLWWSFTTVITGGFADIHNPLTGTGRFVTVGLVLLGLVVTGIFTASLTSVLFEYESSRIENKQMEIEFELHDINRQLKLLSGETNQGLIALETVAQHLSNQRDLQGIADMLVDTMLTD